MAATFQQQGKVIDVAAPRQVSSGDGVLVGSLFGVAQVDALNGAQVPIMTEGVHSLPKTSAQAWSEGDQVFWDDTNHRLDNTAVGKLVGVATDPAANPSAKGSVKLHETVPTQGVFVAAVATTNAVDLPTAEALANQLKTSFNALQATLVAKGIIAAS